MNRFLTALAFILLAPALAAPQEPEPPEPSQQQTRFDLKIDALARQEWTQEIFDAADQFHDENRWRLQLRPRVEAGFGPVRVGVGGDFNYSKDENNEPPPALQRDNYDSRDARLDVAFGGLQLGPLRAQVGRLIQPLPLSEMLWDRDLRIQGVSGTLEFRDLGEAVRSIGATAVYAPQDAHVFDTGATTLLLFSAGVTMGSANGTELELMGSYLKFTEFDGAEPLEPMIRRQNSRTPTGMVAGPFEVMDVVARIRRTGHAPMQLVADYSWNRALDADHKGLWLAAVLGALQTTPARLEYAYAKVDKDATLAAFATDDFFWGTGWEGHRVDIGRSSGAHTSVHAVGQLQRFKDSPRLEERDHWVKRFRLEMRYRR